ncbi:4-hydroxythreonine-4-phosphate dehydrogenase PdxA [Falsiroseomonas bella]|uniref:4-hydroxythreonine-4-phosphate dehydrogenase PdxA n=1 Tax=Falsiroseomonas bella TaxID=2184016 RepID=A0A317F865_9PROT|nr:4-hydroxythreonine-4-phosphate dehydrogenase PdxA [Falsiroseomonas bella]PWS34217.1 4-hydroxythreonine-4-phosphate dehydrogenase PdxA [Falsiroseomonas bella]
MTESPVIAVTMGDPAGIGPEVVLKAIADLAPRVAAGALRPVAVGTVEEFARTNAALGLGSELVPFGTGGVWPRVEVVAATRPEAPTTFGVAAAEGGRQAHAAIVAAVGMAMRGEAAAIATAPISKEALNGAGIAHPGHTELLAALTRARDSRMMLAHGDLRVVHVTTHVALARVPALLTPERLRRTLDLTLDALRRLGIARPRIAVAALNPHAGEGGLFGEEDDRVNVPVIAEYRARGEDVTGPHPGDTVFVKAAAGQFDAVIAMYHDQGHIPVKLLGFKVDRESGRWTGLNGVNVTLGLPIIRTSVDHGTAFDIAGRGIAAASSMVEAIEYAAMLAAGGAA